MKKFDMPVKVYNATEFSWKGNMGSAEASSLKLAVGECPGDQCYTDACDSGFKVYSYRTGKTVEFCLWSSSQDGWVFKSVCETYELHIWND